VAEVLASEPVAGVLLQLADRSLALPAGSDVSGWARAALAASGHEGPAQLAVRVVDADEGRALNHDYRGKDGPTNVLSFPAPPLGYTHDGDADAREMEALEQRILAGLGHPDPYAGEAAAGAALYGRR